MRAEGVVNARRRSPTAGFIAALALAALFIVVASLMPEPKKEVAGGIGATISSPLPGGTRMSLRDAVRAAETPVYRASSSAASDDLISEVWVRTGNGAEVMIFYETGVVTIIKPVFPEFSLEEYSHAQALDGVPGGIRQVGGLDAFVVDPGAGERGASVTFIISESIVTALAADPTFGISADDLSAVAISIIERAGQLSSEKSAAL